MQREKKLECNLPVARDCRHMGLLSLFNRRSGEAASSPTPVPAAAGEEPAAPANEMPWRCGAIETYALGEHVQAVRMGSEPPQILPAFAVEFASACQEWKTLDDHVAHYADRHGWDSLQVESLYRILPKLQSVGALISGEQVMQKLGATKQTSSEGPGISVLGFPTGGDRVELLDRAIRSFRRNFAAHGRTVPFLVADSSSSDHHTEAFRTRLSELARELSVSIAFCSTAGKESFARELAKADACSYEAAEFALLDPLGTGFACGANRNALLLQGAGQMLCSIDDDVVCDLFSAPAERTRLALFGNRDPFSRWLFPDAESAEKFAHPAEADFLAVHEQMLGRSAADVTEGVTWRECSFENLGDHMLERISRRERATLQVRSTFLGHLGDPGIPTSLYYLYYDGENRRRLTETEEHYRSVFGSRSVHTIVTAPSVGDASVSPGMAMGLDHREFLPPFFPVLHAEDFSWSAALWQCCGGALMGHLPFAIRHAPPRKPILTPDDFGEKRRAVVFEWAHLLRYLMFEFNPAPEQSDVQRAAALGRFLSDFAKLSPRDFAHSIGEITLKMESQRLSWLERELREDTETPDYWRDDLERHIENVRSSLSHDDFDIPFDLKTKGTPAECRAFMQSALGRYGNLLQEWPGLVQGAAALRDSGRPLFQPLG